MDETTHNNSEEIYFLLFLLLLFTKQRQNHGGHEQHIHLMEQDRKAWLLFLLHIYQQTQHMISRNMNTTTITNPTTRPIVAPLPSLLDVLPPAKVRINLVVQLCTVSEYGGLTIRLQYVEKIFKLNPQIKSVKAYFKVFMIKLSRRNFYLRPNP